MRNGKTALGTGSTTGITVNAICPGWVLTPLVQKQIDDRAAAEKISVEQATKELFGEKKNRRGHSPRPSNWGPSRCSRAHPRRAIFVADGGWTAQ
jgi:3-hydroxybutyrate dehydrogenase